MLSKIFNLRNILLLVLIVFLLIVILRQQPVIDEKISAYSDAKSSESQITEIGEEQSLKTDMSGTASEEEDFVRGEGYIFPGEKVIDYQN